MYDILFNDITWEALKKFLKYSHDKDIKKTLKREEMIAEIKKKFDTDKNFLNTFKSFYKEIEKAGRKDFWFVGLQTDITSDELNSIRNRIKKLDKEGDDIYLPEDVGNEKYFDVSSNANFIEVKVIRKKELREPDNTKNKTEGDYLFLAYKIKEIRHVSYYNLDLSKNRIIIGVDVWKNLTTKEKLKEVERDIDHIFGVGFWAKTFFIDIKEKSGQLLRNNDHIITKELTEKIADKNQSAIFSIDTGNISTIRKALNNGTIQLNQIKTKYIEEDVRDNEVYRVQFNLSQIKILNFM
jgi:hypothetical protein